MRLDRFLAECAIGKRKYTRRLIKDGHISVNGTIETNPAININELEDIIIYNNTQVKHHGNYYYMFNKPAGYVTAKTDDKDKTIFEFFKGKENEGLFPVGRLDKDTEGLIFLTNDGNFNHNLMHPEKHVAKTYLLWAFGNIDSTKISMLENGLSIGDDIGNTKPSIFTLIKNGTFCNLKSELEKVSYTKIRMKNDTQPVFLAHLTISEGKKHQVKRMLKAIGCFVVYLKRIQIGEVFLDSTLDSGKYRPLTSNELRLLTNSQMKTL